MNTKDALQTLLKIAQKQQKMIEKLAQLTNQPLPPQHLAPQKPVLNAADVVKAALSPMVAATVQMITERQGSEGPTLEVKFLPGKASQAALDHIIKVVQHLVHTNKLSFAYAVKAV